MSVLRVLIPIAIALICFFQLKDSAWIKVTSELTIVLSLLSGAILLRIMRSFPINNPSSFGEEGEIEDLENSLLTAMKSLVTAACSVVAAIVLLLFGISIMRIDWLQNLFGNYLDNLYSAILGYLTVFIFERMVYVIQLDFSILRKQAMGVRLAYKQIHFSFDEQKPHRKNEDSNYNLKDDAEYPGRKSEANS